MPKKKFQAIKATTAEADGLIHDTREFKFEPNGTFVIEDEGLAREIDQVHGKKGTQNLAIVPYDDKTTREPGHKYTFGPSAKFACAWDAFQKRRKDRKPSIPATNEAGEIL
jgi:hypothetical protein